jgi:hypothetical protein
MHHHASFGYGARLFSRFSDVRLPLTLGILIMALGLWDSLHGMLALNDATQDREQTAATMSFLCGIYLLLTGLWLATRSSLTLKRTVGLAVMLAGILGGTWIGIRLTGPNRDDFVPAYIAFFAGLLVHFLGVLCVRKD